MIEGMKNHLAHLADHPRLAIIIQATANLALVLLWGWFYRPVYPYLATIFTREEFRTNQIVLVSVAVLIVLQVRKGNLQPRFGEPPQLYAPALAMALAASALFLAAEHFLDINTLSASLFGLASYGLLGLWLRPSTWRSGIPAALLLIGALPFGEHMQTFVGYPVRIMTARIVQDGLAALGAQSTSVDTILVFENGVSQVDLPCSGVKSLWTGALFLLAATWIERRPINLRWGLVSLAFAGLLLTANLARVAGLVSVGQVLGWRLLAEMLHVPLGVVGFIGACGAALAMLRWSGQTPGEVAQAQAQPASAPARPSWLAPLLAGAVAVMLLLYAPRLQPALAQSAPDWQLPAELATKPWPFSPGELEWLSQGGPVLAHRWQFEWHGERGSMLLLSSPTWRAHHRPERCFQVYGLNVENAFTSLVQPDFPVRLLSLGSGRQHGLMSAAYWLQSKAQATDDYAARIWADISPDHESWVLVTILFEGPVDPLSADSQALYLALRQSVGRSLEGGMTP